MLQKLSPDIIDSKDMEIDREISVYLKAIKLDTRL